MFRWSQANCLWAISLYLNLGSAIRKIYIIRQKTWDTELSEEGARELVKQEREQYINIIQVTGRSKNSHLILVLPPGWL